MTEKKIFEDCSVYQMNFKDGEYIFTFSVSGECSNLNPEKYILEYSSFLKAQKNFINKRNGKVILNFYGFNGNKVFRNSIVSSTERYFKKSVTIIEIDKERITLEINK